MNHKVVILLPAGRRRMLKNTLRALRNSDWDVIDEIRICENTVLPKDVKHIKKLEAFVEKVSVLRVNSRISFHNHESRTYNLNMRRFKYFYKSCNENKTVYIRLDDDMLWMEKGLISSLVEFTLNNQHYIAVFPNLVNNTICDYNHQRLGVYDFDDIRYLGDAEGHEFSWSNSEFTELKHKKILESIKSGDLDKYRFTRFVLTDKPRMGAGFMAWWSGSFDCNNIGDDDEVTITQDMAKESGRNGCIFGEKLAVHYSYHVQRLPEYLLDEYEKINHGYYRSNNCS